MTKIKLCGLTRDCDIEAANQLLPEYIGFVFARKSRRYVSPERALELKKKLHPSIQAVGVFVNETPENVADLLERKIIDVAQLHGKEDETYIAALRKLTDRPIIKAFRIDTQADLEKALQSSADFILLDSGEGGTGTTFNWELLEKNIPDDELITDQPTAGERTIDQPTAGERTIDQPTAGKRTIDQSTASERTIDQPIGEQLADTLPSLRPFFLAGGLTPENIADAVTTIHPFAVDVSSGIETDGFKDINKMSTFVRAVRAR